MDIEYHDSPSSLSSSSAVSNSWVALFKLYKNIGEDDILRGLFSKEIAKHSLTKQALYYELNGDYLEAFNIYEKATQSLDQQQNNNITPSPQEQEQWENGRLECLVKLTRWNDLAENTLEEIENTTDKLWEDNYKNPYLDYFLLSHIKLKERWADLWNFIDISLNNDFQRRNLEENFSPELALISITRNDFDRAKYYVNLFYKQWLETWEKLHPFDLQGRNMKLQQLQTTVEMEEFLNFISYEKNFSSISTLNNILSQWQSRYPDSNNDDINIWDNVVTNRAVLMEKLNERYAIYWNNNNDNENEQQRINTETSGRSAIVDLSSVKSMLVNERANMYSAMATGARKQKNFYVADLYLRLCLKAKAKKKEFVFGFFESLVKLYCLKAQHSITHPTDNNNDGNGNNNNNSNNANYTDSIEKFAKALNFIEGKKSENVILNSNNFLRKYNLLRGNVYKRLADLSQDFPSVTIDALTANKLDSILQNSNNKNITDKLYQHSLQCYETAVNICQQPTNISSQASQSSTSSSSSSSSSTVVTPLSCAKTYLQFALFCDDLLKREEQKQSPNNNYITELSNTVISRTLDAMQLNGDVFTSENTSELHQFNSEKFSRTVNRATDSFPRLLELIGKYPTLQSMFISKTKDVPSWMFLRWLSQMMAILAQKEGKAILPILQQIATLYPQAIYFPFKITSEYLSSSKLGSSHVNSLQQILQQSSSISLLDRFVHNLHKLTHPEHRFKDYIDDLKALLKNTSANSDKIREVFREMFSDLFDASLPDNQGSYNKKFATEWRSDIEKTFGKDGQKLLHMEMDTFIQSASEISGRMMSNMQKKTPKGTATMKLSEFSTFLNDFEQSDQLTPEFIEIPGQYTGLSRPQPEYHVKVSGFDGTLLVMGSLRKPKRLKMRGNDERDYPFLVKGGEDLRLDQRIQQLFTVMNQIFQNNTQAAKRNLKIKTYKVVPMTSRVGMIEWLENTVPLKDIIEEELCKVLGKRRSEVSILKIEAALLQDAWIKSFGNKIKGNKKGQCDMYYVMFQHATRVETEKQVLKQHSTIPSDLLKKGILALSASPEAYLSIRAQYARTLAVFNVCSYILGIGDRHLENFLLNQTDGGLVGIDFGHAFGTATQFLPIPELMPFRLTRQFIQFLQPLDADGLLKHNMVHALTALQENKDVLLNTMNVFVQEPLIDWEKLARRVAKEQGGDENSQWFPKKKVDIARRKLELANPAYITWSELKESVHAPHAYIKSLQDIVFGDQKVNIRARVKERCSDVKQQVDCLVDQATDPNILGRSWFGWAPWI